MSRFRVFLVSGLVANAGVAATAPSASAQATQNEHASCVGVLSSFVGADPLSDIVVPGVSRDDFAPQPGAGVSGLARVKGETPGLPTLINCAIAGGLFPSRVAH
jgi:hypothetical protein